MYPTPRTCTVGSAQPARLVSFANSDVDRKVVWSLLFLCGLKPDRFTFRKSGPFGDFVVRNVRPLRRLEPGFESTDKIAIPTIELAGTTQSLQKHCGFNHWSVAYLYQYLVSTPSQKNKLKLDIPVPRLPATFQLFPSRLSTFKVSKCCADVLAEIYITLALIQIVRTLDTDKATKFPSDPQHNDDDDDDDDDDDIIIVEPSHTWEMRDGLFCLLVSLIQELKETGRIKGRSLG
ncbi:hypothetical protein T439DRAFT_177466 [Meredithblackwellia eburnea MCA 4105]